MVVFFLLVFLLVFFLAVFFADFLVVFLVVFFVAGLDFAVEPVWPLVATGFFKVRVAGFSDLFLYSWRNLVFNIFLQQDLISR